MDQADRPAAPDPEPGRVTRALQGRNRRLTFRFVQFEFPWALGPPDGRFVIREPGRGAPPSHVLVLRTIGAPQRRTLRRTGRRAVRPEPEPEPVTTSRATVIEAVPSPDDEHARAWAKSSRGAGMGLDALAVLNRTLHAHRVSAAATDVHDVSLAQALVVRAGFGAGEEVADGRWAEAIELQRPERAGVLRRGDAALRPQERFAALLGGHDRPLACEELTLRARQDLNAGRVSEALLGLDTAMRAAAVELAQRPGRASLRERLDELDGLQDGVSQAARDALTQGVTADHQATGAQALERLEAALRARSAAGVGPSV